MYPSDGLEPALPVARLRPTRRALVLTAVGWGSLEMGGWGSLLLGRPPLDHFG